MVSGSQAVRFAELKPCGSTALHLLPMLDPLCREGLFSTPAPTGQLPSAHVSHRGCVEADGQERMCQEAHLSAGPDAAHCSAHGAKANKHSLTRTTGRLVSPWKRLQRPSHTFLNLTLILCALKEFRLAPDPSKGARVIGGCTQKPPSYRMST